MKLPFSCAVQSRPMMSLQCLVKFFSTLSTEVKRLSFAAGANGRIGLPVTMCLPSLAGFVVWHEAQATCLPLMVSSRLKNALPSSTERPVEAGLMFLAIVSYFAANFCAVSTSAYAFKADKLKSAATMNDNFFIFFSCINKL